MQVMKFQLIVFLISSLLWCAQSGPEDITNSTVATPQPEAELLEDTESSEPELFPVDEAVVASGNSSELQNSEMVEDAAKDSPIKNETDVIVESNKNETVSEETTSTSTVKKEEDSVSGSQEGLEVLSVEFGYRPEESDSRNEPLLDSTSRRYCTLALTVTAALSLLF